MNAPLIQAPLEFRQRNGGAQSKGAALILCPKCDAPCFIRHSNRVTETVKDITCHCTNSACGMTFLSQISLVHVYSPGLIDRPDLNLPLCPRDQVPHVMPPDKSRDETEQISMFSG